jgi:hypothetical protein
MHKQAHYTESALDLLCDRSPALSFSLLQETSYPLFQNDLGQWNVTTKKGPLYAKDDIHLWHENYFAKKSFQNQEAVIVYGLGLGYSYFSFASWLKEDSSRKLLLIAEDAKMAKTFCGSPFAKEILSHDQVMIFLPEQQYEMAEELATEKAIIFFAPHIPITEDTKAWQQTLYQKITLCGSYALDIKYRERLFAHFCFNSKYLDRSFFIHRWKGFFQSKPALICGAGPSLEKEYDLIKKMDDRALIFAGGSAIAAMAANEIPYHLAVAVDPNEEEYHRLSQQPLSKSPFLYNMRSQKDLLPLCEGPIGYIRSTMGQIVDLWFEEQIGLQEDIIGINLPDESMSVTMLNLAIAVHLGCDPIIICGVDLGSVGMKRYAKGVRSSQEEPSDKIEDYPLSLPGKKGSLRSNVRFAMEKKAIEIFAKSHPDHTFIDASSLGVCFKEIPFLPLQKIYQTRCTDIWNPQKEITRFIQNEKGIDPMLLQKAKDQLSRSIDLCKEHVAVIIQELSQKGKMAGESLVASIELEEEIAYQLLFAPKAELIEKEHERLSLSYWEEILQVILSHKKEIQKS